jgi:hypothetical protein
MKKIILLITISFLFNSFSFSQFLGNEWIQYSQSYYKIYAHENGIFRIDYNTLLNAGIPINSINPKNLHLISRGQEQYIYIKGESDNVFNPGDYIEFYGQKNDGWLDSLLYVKPSYQVNLNYSLFSDSSAYFLTWDNSTNHKRMALDNDINFSSYAAVPYVFKTSRVDYTSTYFAGYIDAMGLSDAEYTLGEGWFDNEINLDYPTTTKSIPSKNAYSTGPPAKVEFAVVGASNFAQIHPNHHLRVQFMNKTVDSIYDGYKVLRFKFEQPLNQLGSSNTDFTFSCINDLNSGSDRNTVAYVQIKYAHNLNLEFLKEYHFSIPDAIQSKSFLSFTNMNISAGDTTRIYDLTNHRRIKVVFDGTNYKSLVSNSGSEKHCFITSESQVKMVNHIYAVSSTAKFTDFAQIANSQQSDFFIITHNSLKTEAELYKNYRNNSGFKAMVFDIDELYDQYSYGILKHPFSIRNLMRNAWYNFTEKPKDLFLIGKAYRAASDGSAPCYRTSPYYFQQTLVPSFGNPPSDILFTSRILDTLYQPAVPTGRLSAYIPEHVQWYREKVELYEQNQSTPEQWMKNVAHFGGGTTQQEQSSIMVYLNGMKTVIQDTSFGAYVRTFLKTSSDPIQIDLADSIRGIIDNGVSIMNFFGHAAGVGFDISIDDPSSYNNYGKYPFLLANSCYAGDIFQDGNITIISSEKFVLIQNKGVIGYLASIFVGIPGYLNIYSSELYKNISYKQYGKSIGSCIKNTIKSIQSDDFGLKETCLAMIYHGDPAIIINSFPKPDYMVNQQSVYFDPPDISTEIDSFNVKIIATNLGKAINDSFKVQIIRTLPDLTTKEFYIQVKAPIFKDTISLKLPVDLIKGVGLNKIKVTLDYFNEIEEMSELNNTTEVILLIKSSDIVPVYPYKYAIVPSLPVILKASTGNPFSTAQNYIFQLDTTDLFNSPIKQTQIINHSGGVVTWSPTFPVTTDTIVYYWRVSVDSTTSHGYNWRESSFQYYNGNSGWGQAHIYQFKNDDYQFINLNRSNKKFEFINSLRSLLVQTGYYPYIQWNDEWYKLDNQNKYIWAYLSQYGYGAIVAVFDSINAEPRAFPGPTHIEYATEFSTDPVNMEYLKDFINSVPVNEHVLIYSHRNLNPQNFTEPVYQAFESIGSIQIRALQNNIPYIIFGKKGSPIGSAHEVKGTAINSIIQLKDSIVTKWKNGHIESELIGPSIKWKTLKWKFSTSDGILTDTVKLDVIGIKVDGTSNVLISDLPQDSGVVYNLYNRIDANIYPYLKLMVKMKDDSMHTAAQMKRWQVLFDGAPETALDPSAHFIFQKDTILEGQNVFLSTATRNISEYGMDSLLIKYWIIDKNRNVHNIGTYRHRPHPAGDVLIDTIIANTSGLSGLNSIWIEVNPDNDQLEQYHFNNIGNYYFYVNGDKINPILDVTFDGVHILDGDIVSAKPEIQIALKDENKFLALNDTSCFTVFLKYPNESQPRKVFFRSGGQDILQFIPAVLPNNSCKILYKGTFPVDGTYQLIVQARDISQNQSGSFDYKISFEVINKSTITSVMNWPNPFTTATHFVFTLTGSEIPTFFKIQVMTITGKLVKEINLDELGPVHIGRNITQYAWDGTDQYGDRLANGVYLYRVITRLNGDLIEKSETQADQYFKKEFGKMYLMR